MWLVEIIRYGDTDLGVSVYGVFDNYDLIHKTMTEYNSYRAGKYPAYYVTEIGPVNPKDDSVGSRTRHEVEIVR